MNSLGPLELQVMECFWKEGELTVRQLWSKNDFQSRAYTTMMTTMNRLHCKGLLSRRSEKNAYVYWAAQSREQYWKELSQTVISELMELGGTPILTGFVEAALEKDMENLDHLEALILEKQKKRGQS